MAISLVLLSKGEQANRSPLPEPTFALTQEQAETLAAQQQGHTDANSPHGDVVGRWAIPGQRE